MKISHKEITELYNKNNGDKFQVVTEGNILFIVKLIHKITVFRLKRYIKFAERFKKEWIDPDNNKWSKSTISLSEINK